MTKKKNTVGLHLVLVLLLLLEWTSSESPSACSLWRALSVCHSFWNLWNSLYQSACVVGANPRHTACASVNLLPTSVFFVFLPLVVRLMAWSGAEVWQIGMHVYFQVWGPVSTGVTHLEVVLVSKMNLSNVSHKVIIVITCHNTITVLGSGTC